MYIEGDVPSVVTGGATNNGWGNGTDAWVLIILFALIFGWGRNGAFGGGNSGTADNYVLASDFATLQRQIDSATSSLERKGDAINSGLCDGFYAMNTGMLNGFAGVNSAITTNGYETRNAIQGVASQLADCCCKTQTAIQGVNYNIAMQTNSIEKSLCDGFRSLHDELVANRIEDKNAQIAAQQNEINRLQLAASQSAQNSYLLSELKMSPKPAYIVANPFCCNGTGTCGAVV